MLRFRKALYYPNILVPSGWLRWALLYWDKVSSIVPYDWRIQDHSDMKYLYDVQAFEPTRPDNLILNARRQVPIFQKELLGIVDSSEFQSMVRKDWLKQGVIGKIHRSKVSYEIIESLKLRGLAEKNKESPWYSVENTTSLLYMALLAKYLADLDADSTAPSTDMHVYKDISYSWSNKMERFRALNVKFQAVLPVPRRDVPLEDIIKFKDEKRAELLSLRVVFDEYYKALGTAENPNEIKHITVQFKEKFEKGRSDLGQEMKDSHLRRVFESFESLISIKSPALYETIGFAIAKVPWEISVPVTVGTAAIQIGCSMIASRNKERAEIRESPFSYLYHAKKAGLL